MSEPATARGVNDEEVGFYVMSKPQDTTTHWNTQRMLLILLMDTI